MKNNNPEMEDDLRAEYDLKSLEIRDFGTEHTSFAKKSLNMVESEIDFLVIVLEDFFVSKRTRFQEEIVHLKKNTNWKRHRKYFQVGIVTFFVIFYVLLKTTVDLSRSGNVQNYRFIGVLLIFSFLFFLLAAVVCMILDQFAWVLDTFRTYQDELHVIKKIVKSNIEKNNYLKSLILRQDEFKNLGVVFLKSYFENRIKKIENGLKVVDSASYVYAILWVLVILLIFGFPKSFDSLLKDSTQYSLLLGVFLFSIAVMQSILKSLAYSSGYSLIGNHQECLRLLGEIELMSGLIEKMSLTLHQSGIVESKRLTQERSSP